MSNKYQYCLAENWGKGFITFDDAMKFKISDYPGNIYQIPANNQYANLWIYKVAGTKKTKEEAQTIINQYVQNLQNEWDALPENSPSKIPTNPAYGQGRPKDITIIEE